MHHKEIEMQEDNLRNFAGFGQEPPLNVLGRPLNTDDERLAAEFIAESGLSGAHSAADYLNQARAEMEDRAASRDKQNGERSMGRAVRAFNALYGTNLTETQGWQFMAILKAARAAGGAYREDDYTDAVAYAALAAESAGRGDA